MNITNPNRREFLQMSAVAGAGAVLAGCAVPPPTAEQKRLLNNQLIPLPKEKDIRTRFNYLGYNSADAKAAFEQMGGYEGRFHVSLSKYVNGGSIGFSNGGWGQLLENNGRYAISTVPHVVENAGYLNDLTMHVPNVGFINVQGPQWYRTKNDGVAGSKPDNWHYYFPLDQEISRYINSARKQRLLEPVTPATSLPGSDEVMGMLIAEDRQFYAEEAQSYVDYFTTRYYSYSFNRIMARANSGNQEVCNYSSGESAFKLVERNGQYMLNGEVYGTLTGSPYYIWEKQGMCDNDAAIKPFYNFDWAGNLEG